MDLIPPTKATSAVLASGKFDAGAGDPRQGPAARTVELALKLPTDLAGRHTGTVERGQHAGLLQFRASTFSVQLPPMPVKVFHPGQPAQLEVGARQADGTAKAQLQALPQPTKPPEAAVREQPNPTLATAPETAGRAQPAAHVARPSSPAVSGQHQRLIDRLVELAGLDGRHPANADNEKVEPRLGTPQFGPGDRLGAPQREWRDRITLEVQDDPTGRHDGRQAFRLTVDMPDGNTVHLSGLANDSTLDLVAGGITLEAVPGMRALWSLLQDRLNYAGTLYAHAPAGDEV